jgi:hypothetical protein
MNQVTDDLLARIRRLREYVEGKRAARKQRYDNKQDYLDFVKTNKEDSK